MSRWGRRYRVQPRYGVIPPAAAASQTVAIGAAAESDTPTGVGRIKVKALGVATETDLGGTSFADDFNRADSGSIGADWVEGETAAISIVSNQLKPVSGGGENVAIWATPTTTTTQYAQVTMPTSGIGLGPMVRCDGSATDATRDCYHLRWVTSTNLRLTRLVDNAGGSAQAITLAFQPGDVVRLEAAGANIRGYVNGVLRIDYTDGTPLLGQYVGVHGVSSTNPCDDFFGGDLASAAVRRVRTLALGTATETDTAVGVTAGGPTVVAVGTATETDTPTGLTARKTVTLGAAAETDTAVAVGQVKTLAVGAATETDTIPGGRSFSDNFDRASLGSDWSSPTGSIVSNQFAVSDANDRFHWWTTQTDTDNCYAEAVCWGPNNTAAHGVAVRGDGAIAVSMDGYQAWWVSATSMAISRVVNGTRSTLGSTVTVAQFVSGDSVRLEAEGDTLRMYRNGSLIATRVDPSPIYPGRYVALFTSTATNKFDDFLGGDLSGAALGRIKTTALGAATETGTAVGVGRIKVLALGTATETDAAAGVTPVMGGGPIVQPITAATETDTATGVTARKTLALGTATETDVAVGVGGVRAVGTATEADSATGVTARKTKALGAAAETDAATGVTRRKTRAVGTATETDSPTGVTRRKTRAVGAAAETDAATGVTRRKTRAVGTATETDSATGVSRGKRKTLGTAAETDTAQQVTRAGFLGYAIETDTATGVARIKRKTLGTATSTESATGFARKKLRTLGVATEVDTAIGVTPVGPIIVALGTAYEVDAALSITLVMTADEWTFMPPAKGPGERLDRSVSRMHPRNRLLRRIPGLPVHYCVMIFDADTTPRVVKTITPRTDQMEQADFVYLGPREYVVGQQEKDILEAAGFGESLVPVGGP